MTQDDKALPIIPDASRQYNNDLSPGSMMQLGHSLDISFLLNRIDQDIEFAAELLLTFQTEAQAILEEISSSNFENFKAERLMCSAHKLKGMCKDIGAVPLANLTEQLENLGPKMSLEEAHPYLIKIQDAGIAVEQEINAWLRLHSSFK